MSDEECDRLTRQAFDDLHRIAEALEKIAVNGLAGQLLIERLAEISLHVSAVARKIQ